MRTKAALLVLTVACLVGCSNKASAPATPTTDDDKALYALGALMGANIREFDLTDQELVMVKAGFADSAQNKSTMDDNQLQEMMGKLGELHRTRTDASATKTKAAGAAYLAKAAGDAGATKTDSGLVIRITQPGSGAKPVASDMVRVHYTGKFIDGKVFDSSVERGEPAEFPLQGVIPCWTEAVQLMQVGSKATVICPPDLAYGDEGRPQMPGGSTLVFDVELLDIVKPAR
jgi:FKBP-type peptidyl-prolyl cis-trans isomerase